VSKTDSSLNVDRYIKTHPNVESTLAPEFENEKQWTSLLNEVGQLRLQTEENQKNSQQLARELTREYNKHAAAKRAKEGETSSQKKRKRNEDGHPAGMIVPSHDIHINSWTNFFFQIQDGHLLPMSRRRRTKS
jgi:hypothetical protein